MIFINPWWIHHCAGNLDPENDPYSDNYKSIHHCAGNLNPENDPYSDDYKSPIYGFSIIQLILTLFIFCLYTGLYGLALYYIITTFLVTNNIFIFFILFLIVLLIYVILLIITLDKILK